MTLLLAIASDSEFLVIWWNRHCLGTNAEFFNVQYSVALTMIKKAFKSKFFNVSNDVTIFIIFLNDLWPVLTSKHLLRIFPLKKLFVHR